MALLLRPQDGAYELRLWGLNTTTFNKSRNVYCVQRLWAFVAQSLSRMGPRQVIAAAAQNVVSLHDSNNKRNGQEFSLLVSSRGPTESLDPS